MWSGDIQSTLPGLERTGLKRTCLSFFAGEGFGDAHGLYCMKSESLTDRTGDRFLRIYLY